MIHHLPRFLAALRADSRGEPVPDSALLRAHAAMLNLQRRAERAEAENATLRGLLSRRELRPKRRDAGRKGVVVRSHCDDPVWLEANR